VEKGQDSCMYEIECIHADVTDAENYCTIHVSHNNDFNTNSLKENSCCVFFAA